MNQKVSKEVKPWTEYIASVLSRINTRKETVAVGRKQGKEHPNRTTEFTPEEASKPENWFEVHNNMELEAKRNMKYPEINIGDKVKVFKQRGALEKEWVGDYKPCTTTVTNITKSLGQTFYKVTEESKPFIRSEILLSSKKTPDAVLPEDHEPAPYLSRKREQITKRDNKQLLKENQHRHMGKKQAIKANAIEEAKGRNAEVDKVARSIAEQNRQQKTSKQLVSHPRLAPATPPRLYR